MTATIVKTTKSPERPAGAEGNFYHTEKKHHLPGMNDRVRRLRKQSVETPESLSIERALITTKFYKRKSREIFRTGNAGAQFSRNLQTKNHLYRGNDELIVGERGPRPKIGSHFP
jgi:trans-4-hydroxy-L-proline dehydratase